MQGYFDGCVTQICALESPAEVRLNVIATLRLAMHQCCYGLLEWLASRHLAAEERPSERLLAAMLAASDGTLVDALAELSYCADRAGWLGVATIPFQKIPEASCAARLCEGYSPTLDGLLRSMVSIRNDGGEGHGLPGEYDVEAEKEGLRVAIEILRPLMPIQTAAEQLEFGPDGQRVSLGLLRSFSGAPTLIRKLKTGERDRITVTAQIPTGLGERQEVSYQAADPFFSFGGKAIPEFDLDPSLDCFVSLPDRITDTFLGRANEIENLREWLDDADSRTALVFGDGGLGKTTLVVEFVHQLLEEKINSTWRPKYICFYTAKKTQWGPDGLRIAKSGSPRMLDLLATLHCLFLGSFPKPDWYRMDVQRAVDRFSGELTAQRLVAGRDDVLIIVDNAETLIETEAERTQLGLELRQVSRRLGRVIVTSRRREYLEATPIEVPPLSPIAAVDLLRKRGWEKLKIPAIRDASDAVLLQAVGELECRPLVLDAFLRKLCDPAIRTLRTAITHINQMLARDLGAFLFEDAWQRLDRDLRHLLLVMTRVADVHDGALFRMSSEIMGVPVGRAEAALSESGGIASISKIDGEIQIVFSYNFLRFANEKSVRYPDGSVIPDMAKVEQVRRLYSDYMEGTRLQVNDRIPQAFRHPAARMARIAAREGRPEDAHRYYEQAALSDQLNGWLFDRYAYFLYHERRDLPAAVIRSKKAVELLPDEGEPWFTKGMIEARLGERRAFEQSLSRAESLGVGKIRCSLQRAWGYTRCRPPQVELARRELEVCRSAVPKDR
jgi:tetratricopeptide (TPR) repeat protein